MVFDLLGCELRPSVHVGDAAPRDEGHALGDPQPRGEFTRFFPRTRGEE